MKRYTLLLSLSLALVLAPACKKDDPAPVPAPPTEDADTTVEPEVVDPTPDGGPADTGPDAEVIVEPATIQYYLVTAAGNTGEGEDQVTLFPEDEPANYVATPGFQVDLIAQTTGVSTGRICSLYIDGVKTREVVVVDGLDTVFQDVGMPASTDEGYDVYVEVTTEAGETIQATKKVIVSVDTCDLAISPTSEDGCILTDDSEFGPGFQVRFVVTHTGGKCQDASVSVELGGVTFPESPNTEALVDGQAEFFITLPDDLDGIPVTVTAHVTHPTSTSLNASTSGEYIVDNSVPALAFDPDGLGGSSGFVPELKLSLDSDQNPANGIQYNVVVGVTGLSETDVDSVSLTVDEEVVGTGTPGASNVLFSDLTFTQQGDVTLVATGVDACGNTSSTTMTVPVYSTIPSVAVLNPAGGTTLLAKDNIQVSDTQYLTQFQVEAEGVVPGLTSLSITCTSINDPDTWLNAGTLGPNSGLDAVAADNNYLVNATLNVLTMGNNTSCRAELSKPNGDVAEPVALTVALPAPGLILATPSTTSETKLNAWEVSISGTATSLTGQPIFASLSSEGGIVACSASGADNAADGTFSTVADFAAACPDLVDGSYTLSVNATDQYGNQAVPDGADTSGTTASLNFDTQAPTVAILSPADATVLDPAANPDQDPATLIYDISVQAELQGETEAAGTELCLSTGAFNSCLAPDAGTFQATWPAVPMVAGDNVIVINGTDGHGNAAAPQSITVTYNSDAPGIALVSPTPPQGASLLYTNVGTVDITMSVSTPVDGDTGAGGDPITDANVSLQVGSDTLGDVATNNGDGTYTFTGVGLTENQDVTFYGVAEVTGLEAGVNLLLTVHYKTTQPGASVTDVSGVVLVPGTYVNLDSTACIGSPDCIATVNVQTQDAEAGSAVDLEVDCSADDTDPAPTYSATTTEANGAVALEGVTLTHGGSCTLTPTVTDLAGSTVAGGSLTFNVDRQGPVLTWAKPVGDQLIAGDDSQSIVEGLQSEMVVGVSGLESGQNVFVQLDSLAADQTTTSTVYTYTMTQDVSDAGQVAAVFGDPATPEYVTWPEGTVTLTATTVDAAGNPSTSVPPTKVITVEADSPSVLATLPAAASEDDCDADTPCPSGEVCYQNKCWLGWSATDNPQVLFNMDGFITTTQNHRICSDNASLAGTSVACTTDGFYQVQILDVPPGALPAVTLTNLPQGYHTFIGELKADPNSDFWTSSVDEDNVTQQYRRVYYDTVSPSVADQNGDGEAIWSPSELGPAGGGGADNTLNIAEFYNEQDHVYLIAVESDEVGTVTIYVNNLPRVEDQDIAVGSNTYEVTLDEGGNEIYAVITDLVGNTSTVPGEAGLETYTPTVDTAIPQASFVYPSKGQLNLSDKAIDGADVKVSCNIELSTVYLRDFGTLIDTVSVTDGVATFSGALEKCVSGLNVEACTSGNHQYTATVVAYVSANNNYVESVPTQISVDFEAPVGTISTPVPGQVFGDAVGALVDSDPEIPGFQVAVTFSTDVFAQSWEIFLSDCADDATYTNCETEVLATNGVVQQGGGINEPTEDVTIPISTALSYKKLILRTTDGVGNTHDDVVPLVFDIQTCVVAFTNLPETTYFNASYCAGAAASCATADLSLDAKFFGPCGGVNELELIVDGAESATQTSIDFDTQTATFLVTVADGTTAQLELKALNDGAGDLGLGCGSDCVASSGQQPRVIDLSPPVITLDDSASLGLTLLNEDLTLPTEGSTVVYNATHDTSLSAGLQHHVAVVMNDANANGGRILSVSATVDASAQDLSPSNVTLPVSLAAEAVPGSSPLAYQPTASQGLLNLTFTDLATQVVTISAEDAAGNAGSVSYTATVDTVPPAPVVLTNDGAGNIQAGNVNNRLPSVDLAWTAVGDNGDGSGDDEPATSYDIRYSLAAIDTPEKFEVACPVTSLMNSAATPTPAAPGSAEAYTVSGPDMRHEDVVENGSYCKFVQRVDGGSYHFAVRAIDDAGNLSDITAEQSVKTDEVAYSVSRVSVSPPGAVGWAVDWVTYDLIPLGDVNDDDIEDLGVSINPGYADAFCVLYGHDYPAETIITTLKGDNHECFAGAATLTGDAGGNSLGGPMVALGDVNGDGKDDFSVAGLIGGEGFVAVYLGVTKSGDTLGPDLSNPNLIIRGASAGWRMTGTCAAGNFNGDVNPFGGQPLNDIAFGSGEEDTLYVIAGDPNWKAATTHLTIDMSDPADQATYAFFTIDLDLGTQEKFGDICAPAGDLLPTPDGAANTDDLLIGERLSGGDAAIYVVPGRVTSGTGTLSGMEGALTAEDELVVRMRPDQLGLGFGQVIDSNVDLTGDGVPDVVASHYPQAATADGGSGKSVYIFDGAQIYTGAGEYAHRINAPGAKVEITPGVDADAYTATNGNILYGDATFFAAGCKSVGNLDGWLSDGKETPDLFFVHYDGDGDKGEIRYNHVDGNNVTMGLYPYTDLTLSNPNNSGAESYGVSAAGIDMDGDGRTDLVVGTAFNEMYIYR